MGQHVGGDEGARVQGELPGAEIRSMHAHAQRRKHSPDLFDEDDSAHRSGKTARGGSPDDLDTRNFEDFERKRRKEKKKKLGLLDEEDEEERKRRKERKKREAEAEAMGLDAKGVMGIKYMPRGGMREWDMGKET